jgi:hypothetical protein
MNEHAITETQGVAETAFELFGDHLGRFRQHLIDQNQQREGSYGFRLTRHDSETL